MEVGDGIYLVFESDPGYRLNIDRLDYPQRGIEVTALRKEVVVSEEEGEEATKDIATVFVSEGELSYFFHALEKYLEEETRSGNPRYQDLVETISEVKLASLEEFWTEPTLDFPEPEEQIWWEAWLRKGENQEGREQVVQQFREQCRRAGLETSENELLFPENTIVLVHGSPEELSQSVLLLDCLAEVRKARMASDFFLNLSQLEQEEAIREALDRITVVQGEMPTVCLLDTGVNRGHPLLSISLDPDDMHASNPDWGVDDTGDSGGQGHGTLMAGLSLYGDLVEILSSDETVQLRHRLESVKVIPPSGQNEPEVYGEVTKQGISRTEIQSPDTKRVICLAVTTEDGRDQGRPSSWSGAIDSLAYGSDADSRDKKRLIIVSAGNKEVQDDEEYPNENYLESVHDPGQAWNAVTVGAYTEKETINPDDFPEWTPLADSGKIGPASTTSNVWESQWPMKPDIVMEGGNRAVDPNGTVFDGPSSLRLVTTNDRYQSRSPLVQMGATSASTALAAKMAASIRSRYPDLWEETIRGLMIHSADWTPQMLNEAKDDQQNGVEGIRELNGGEKEFLLRSYGYGTPDLGSAIRNADNVLTLISEESLQPFERDNGRISSKDLNFHDIPWPSEELRQLGHTRAKMKVTLSYFIEPNPGRSGYVNSGSYRSCGLRFKVKRPTENTDSFRAKVNAEARGDSYSGGSRSYDNWALGMNLRTKGSIHRDTWQGTAADLAEMQAIAVYPVGGWWRYRKHKQRWEREIRYSLTVSIATPEVETNLYNRVRLEQPTVGLPQVVRG
jgi:hypothetical protein